MNQGRIAKAIGITLIVLGIAFSKPVLEKFSPDGTIVSPTRTVVIVIVQIFAVAFGALIYYKPPSLSFSRHSVAAILIMLLALAPSAFTFRRQIDFLDGVFLGNAPPDPVTLYGEKFEQVRKQIAEDSLVGYTSPYNDKKDHGLYIHHYFLTQYSCAPTIVRNSSDEEMVIDNRPDRPILLKRKHQK